jgi:hypothetical protein
LQQELAFERAFDVVAVREVEGLGPGVGAQHPQGDATGAPPTTACGPGSGGGPVWPGGMGVAPPLSERPSRLAQ